MAASSKKFSVYSMLNTALNPFAGRFRNVPLVGDIAGERWTPRGFKPFGGEQQTEADRLAFQSALVGSTYAAIILAGKLVASRTYRDKHEQEVDRSLHSVLSARRPLLGDAVGTIDLADAELMLKEGQAGDARTRATSLDALAMLLPVAALVAGVYGADRLHRNVFKERRGAQLDDKLRDSSAELADLRRQSMLQARGLLKEESNKAQPSWFTRGMRNLVLRASGALSEEDRSAGVTSSLWAMLALLAAGAMGVSAVATKDYFDKRDESRARYKQIQALARRMASASAPPVIMSDLPPEAIEQLDRHIKRPAPARARLALPPPEEPAWMSAASADDADDAGYGRSRLRAEHERMLAASADEPAHMPVDHTDDLLRTILG